MKQAIQNSIIRLSQFVPQSLRSALAASSHGLLARRILNRVNVDPFPIASLCGPLAGQRMRVNWALHKTYVFGTHEPLVMQTIKDIVRPGWTAVDVGAHIGYSTLLLAQCVGPAGKVIAFEPLAENFKMLQENVQLNGHATVITENLALMDRSGRIELRSATPGAMTWVASANIDSSSTVESQSVEVIPFDSYAQQKNINKVDFIKMDVEGAEAAVLGGMNEILKRDKPILLIEIHGYLQLGDRHPALMKLKGQNYTVTNLGKRNWEIHVLAQAARQSHFVSA